MTMLDGDAVRNAAEMGAAAMEAEKHLVHVKVAGEETERPFTTRELFEVRPNPDPKASVLALRSLEGLVDYLTANKDGLELKTLAVHVVSPTEVAVFGPLRSYHRDREYYVKAAINHLSYSFGHFVSVETLVVTLQHRFRADEERSRLLKLIGNVTGEEQVRTKDDGVSQEVNVRRAAYMADRAPVENPFTLRPFRTFPEVETKDAEASPFILRLTGTGENVKAALFEADGGAWERGAVDAVGEYLTDNLPKTVAIIR